MKFPIRRKVLLLTLALSLALVAASVFISYTIFSARVRKNAAELCLESAASTAELIEMDYSRFLQLYRSYAETTYAQQKDEIEYMSFREKDFDVKKDFFETLTKGVFPPKGGLGLSYEMSIFHNNYQDLLTELSLVSSAGQMVGGYVFYYDEPSGNVIYLLDSTSDNSPFYNFPFSVEKADKNLMQNVLKTDTPRAYFEDTFCISSVPVRDEEAGGQIVAYVGYHYNIRDIEESQRSFMMTSGLITLAATLLLALVYFFFVDTFVARHIRTLSRAADSFTRKLEENGSLDPASGGVKTRDELGDLSGRLDLMQSKIIEYVGSLAEKTAREESMKTELDIASRIQLQSLPESGFAAGDVRLDSFIRPAREVGGDLYDYFMTDADHLFFTIADVSGKGVPAALFMMRGKELIKSSAAGGRSPGQIAKAVNDELCKNNEEGLFITAFFGILELSTGKLTYARAGHEQPFLKRGGKAEKISEESNFVLGLFDSFDFEEDSLVLEPGDSLLLYTDGLNEGINGENEEFGYERIRTYLETHGEDELTGLYEALSAFADGTEQFDDVTMLLLKREEKLCFRFTRPDYDSITLFCDALEEKLTDFPQEPVSLLSLMSDEVMNNIISYAVKDRPEPFMEAELEMNGDTARLRFSDNGEPFDPLKKGPADTEADPMERPEGGMGIHLVRQFADSVEYVRRGDKNVLSISKKLR